MYEEDDVFAESENDESSTKQKINQPIINNSSISQASLLDPTSEESKPREFNAASLIDQFRALEQTAAIVDRYQSNKKTTSTTSTPNKQPVKSAENSVNGDLKGHLKTDVKTDIKTEMRADIKADMKATKIMQNENPSSIILLDINSKPDVVKCSTIGDKREVDEIEVKTGTVKDLLTKWDQNGGSTNSGKKPAGLHSSPKSTGKSFNLEKKSIDLTDGARNSTGASVKNQSTTDAEQICTKAESIASNSSTAQSSKSGTHNSAKTEISEAEKESKKVVSPKISPAEIVIRPEEELPQAGTVKNLLQKWNVLLQEKQQNVYKSARPATKPVESQINYLASTEVNLKRSKSAEQLSNEKKKVHFNEEVEELDVESGKRTKRKSLTDTVDGSELDVKQIQELPWADNTRKVRLMFEILGKDDDVHKKNTPAQKNYKWNVNEVKILRGSSQTTAVTPVIPKCPSQESVKESRIFSGISEESNASDVALKESSVSKSVPAERKTPNKMSEPTVTPKSSKLPTPGVKDLTEAKDDDVTINQSVERSAAVRPIYENDINEFPEEFNTRSILAKFRALEVK